MVNICFYDNETQELLGRISKHHLQEAVIPAYSDDYKVFLNRRFETRPDIYYWEVVSQNINDGTVSIYLLPDLDKLPSYGEKAIQFNKHKRTTHFLKQYNIVEVDFGHHVALLEGGSNQKKNTNYLSNLLQYELHKRRPCVVLSVDAHSIQVLPLTTKIKPENLKLSPASLKELAIRYREKSSYFIPSMIQSVSAFRVFPPRLAAGSYADHGKKIPIAEWDKSRIEELLAIRFKPSLKAIIDPLKAEVRKLQTERAKNLDTLNSNKDFITAQETEIDDLKGLIARIGVEELGEQGDRETVIEQLKIVYSGN